MQRKNRRHFRMGAFALLSALVLVCASSAGATTQSSKVLLVPSASGQAGHGGVFPTSGFPGGFAPSFGTTSLASIEDPASNPLTSYDTVVLVQVCNIDTYLANATFKTRVEQFVSGGGKLVIWDSECQGTDYSDFVYPFTTNNPGALGSQSGALNDVEPNSLSNTSTASPYYVDLGLITTDTDAVGDANVMTSQDPHWYVDLTATNANNVTGPLQAYARLGSGLIIYCGFDMDVLRQSVGFDPASSVARDQLARVWLLQLLQPWNPDNLAGSVKVFGLALAPSATTVPVGTTQTLGVHASVSGVAVPGTVVTFSVTSGPNAGVSGSATTDSNGNASFSYVGSQGVGTDIVTASATLDGTPVTEQAIVTWSSVATTSSEIDVFLCYSKWQVQPGVWPYHIAADLVANEGYWLPYAVEGNVAFGTNIGGYHLVCNIASTQSLGDKLVGAGADAYPSDIGTKMDNVPLVPFYPAVGG